uniref:N-acetyltransferase ESCO zinc-finger domain-containing protein n=1 Tax=Acrobeloides nanus TaxID=290746 RepID=A0A914EMQ5_9BILA
MNQKRITDFFASPISVNLSSISYGETSSLSKQTSSLSISSPNTSRPRSRKRRINVEDDPSQLMLDAGQKKLGLEHCKECGMVYSVDTIKDVNLHKDFHNRACETKFFRVTTAQLKTWKSQLYSEVVASKFNGILFRLNGQTKSTLKNKTEIIIK